MASPKQPQDRLRSRKQPRTRTVYVPTDYDLAEEVERLRGAVEAQSLFGQGVDPESEQGRELEAMKERLKEMEGKLKKSSIEFKLRSMGRKPYDTLLQEHPPTDAQAEKRKKVNPRNPLPFNPDTFPIALIARSVVDSDLSVEELEEWFREESWSIGEIEDLFQNCVSINSQSRISSLGKG